MMTRKSRRVLAVMLTLAVLGAGGRWTVVAQQALDCSVNGFCVSNSTSNLLGLPQGTLNIVTYQPWDRVVKNPAAAGWVSLEAEARAAVAGLHGVANDNRLPHAALDDIRALMYLAAPVDRPEKEQRGRADQRGTGRARHAQRPGRRTTGACRREGAH